MKTVDETVVDRWGGFTLIELLIVIVIIGVLLTVGVFVQSGVLAAARDSERADDTASIARLLEQSYNSTSTDIPTYPSTTVFLSDINNRTGFAADANTEIFESPNADKPLIRTTRTNLVNRYETSAIIPIGYYYYQPITETGDLCRTSATPCVLYRIFYRQETHNNAIITLKSAHQQ